MSTTYTADQIDEKLAKHMFEVKRKLDKVIVMASSENDLDPTETSLYMEVIDKDVKG